MKENSIEDSVLTLSEAKKQRKNIEDKITSVLNRIALIKSEEEKAMKKVEKTKKKVFELTAKSYFQKNAKKEVLI